MRERKRKSIRARMEEAALHLFIEKGFTSTTVDEVAAHADVSRSTFFRYFGSKEAILFFRVEEFGDLLYNFILERPAEEPPLQAFEEGLVQLVQATDPTQDRPISEQRQKLFDSDPKLLARARELTHGWTMRLAEALAKREGGEVLSRHRLASAMGVAAAEGISESWLAGDGEDPVELIRAHFSSMRELAR